MKECNHCGAYIPDDTRRCPHCRGAHPRGNWAFQAFLVIVVAATALALILLR
jgi:RNA polymerase subunit RPABC4/transcription elongation factor Spt4